MADGTDGIPDDEKWQIIRDYRNNRELFRGRITNEESFILLRFFDLDRARTVQNVLNADAGEVNDLLNSNDAEERMSFVTRDEVLRELARKNEVAWEVRQYGCADCDKMWWRRVPTRKPVSRCYSCKKKFEPVPRDKEWGGGEFECNCGQTFKGVAAMGQTECMCFRCGNDCPVLRILPPYKRDSQPRPPRNSHSCNAHNCYNRRGRGNGRSTCMHPKSRPVTVLVASNSHVSTGSTVNTFLDQDDLEPDYEPSLRSIPEEDDDSGDDGNNADDNGDGDNATLSLSSA